MLNGANVVVKALQEKYLNTSHVNVKLWQKLSKEKKMLHLNTSHVNVKLN